MTSGIEAPSSFADSFQEPFASQFLLNRGGNKPAPIPLAHKLVDGVNQLIGQNHMGSHGV
jgi:hypothetical protein